tara:strand:- start:109 stop:357 length:249 start_codon:yes stop_codon:yes gene_type:complete
MSNSIENSRLPSEEGFEQLQIVLLSLGRRPDILTVEICRAMEEMYGHIYKIEEMEEHLNELTKNSKLKKAGKTLAEAEGKYR